MDDVTSDTKIMVCSTLQDMFSNKEFDEETFNDLDPNNHKTRTTVIYVCMKCVMSAPILDK